MLQSHTELLVITTSQIHRFNLRVRKKDQQDERTIPAHGSHCYYINSRQYTTIPYTNDITIAGSSTFFRLPAHLRKHYNIWNIENLVWTSP